jgi:hypothetical protein
VAATGGSATDAPASDIAALRAQIAALTARLDQMEAAQKKAGQKMAQSAPTVTTRTKERVTISGLMQVHLRGFSGQSADIDQRADTFRLRRARITLAGRISPRITGTISIDPAKRLLLIHEPLAGAGGIKQRTNMLQDLKIYYLVNRGKTNRRYFDVGQFTIPLGYEGDLVSSRALQTEDRALMFSQRDPFDGGFGSVRDTGMQLRGVTGAFSYWLGVFNGLGERQNNLALSDPKAVVARLMYRPAGVPGLRLGISGARGNTRNTEAPADLPGREILDERADRSVFNLFSAYKRGKLTLQTEYLASESMFANFVGLPPAPGRSLIRREIRSYYGSAGYRFQRRLEGVVRYDLFNFDQQLEDAAARDITLGLNYYIKGNNAKIQANLVHRSGGSGISAANNFSDTTVKDFQGGRTELRLNFQTAF